MTTTAEATGTEAVKCRKCQRPLRSEASRAAGIGPRCAAVEAATEGLSAKQVDKMAQLIIDKAIVATNREGVYKIVNEAGEVIHTVHVNGNCTCEWGLRRKSADTKVCYHVAAARLMAKPVIRTCKAAPVAIPAPRVAGDLWAELDRLNDAFMTAA